MPELFNHYKPFVRIIENDTINSIYWAILSLYDEPESSVTFERGDSDKTIGVLEANDKGGYNLVSHQSVGFFEKAVTMFTNRLIIAIDEDVMNSDNRKAIQEKLKNYRTYTESLIERFNKKQDRISKLLKIIDLQLTRVTEILEERIYRFSGGGEVSSVGSRIKIKWDSDYISLVTIFYDLLNGKTFDLNGKKVGKQFILNRKTEVIDFIHESFLTIDGKPIEKATIRRYMNDKTSSKNKIKLMLNADLD